LQPLLQLALKNRRQPLLLLDRMKNRRQLLLLLDRKVQI